MIEAFWKAEFGTDTGSRGAGVVVLETGRVFGGDSHFYYSGTYKIDNRTNEVVVPLTVRQHSPGGVSIIDSTNPFSVSAKGRFDRDEIQLDGATGGKRIIIRLTRLDELP